MKNIIFPEISSFNEIKESILLQLVSDLNILIIGEIGTCKEYFLNKVRDNFDWINCISEVENSRLSFEKPVLASLTPKDSKFDVGKSIASQIDLVHRDLNRFDVIFIIRDLPALGLDRMIAESLFPDDEKNLKNVKEILELKRKLENFRKIKVKWGDEEKKQLIDFYVEVRNNRKEKTPIIGQERLKSLKKMAEGYAKLQERVEVSESDIEKTKNLFKYYSGSVQ